MVTQLTNLYKAQAKKVIERNRDNNIPWIQTYLHYPTKYKVKNWLEHTISIQ